MKGVPLYIEVSSLYRGVPLYIHSVQNLMNFSSLFVCVHFVCVHFVCLFVCFCVYIANEDIPKDKFVGNRKKLKSKKKAIQDKQYSSLSRWPVPRPKNPYSEPLGLWATQGAPWPEGLDYGTEYHSDREVMCGSDDEELVKAVDRDAFGNHSMLMVCACGYYGSNM